MKQTIIEQLKSVDSASVTEAADLVKTTIENGNIIYLVSADMHSNAVFEPFMKPGFPCALSPMTEPTLSNTSSGSRAYYLRNTENVGNYLCNYYRSLQQGDCIIIADHGEAVATQEIIKFSANNSIKTILISPSSGKADICIPIEKSIDLPAISSVTISLSIGALTCEIMLEALKSIDSPDVWLPFIEQNAQANEQLISKYRNRIKKL